MFDLNIQFVAENEKCLYEQIYEHIKHEIREGKLLCGERLPSTRYLAEYLQVSRSTTSFAYEQLVSEGYIESRQGKGYFVCKMEELYRLENTMADSFTEPMANQAYEGIDFSPTKIDMSHFPFGVWRKINKGILSDERSELFLSGNPKGDRSLREAICDYLHASRGVNARPEQIIVGAGNGYLLMLLEKILGRHVPVAMDGLTYKRAYRILDSFAYPITTLPMDDSGMVVSALYDTDVRLVYVMPARQYPLGHVMPIGRRSELLKWANEKDGRYLIEDDYDSEFRYKGKPIPSLQALDKTGKVIYLGTFSKSIAPAIRVSYMVLPKELLEEYDNKCYFYSATVSRIDQKILEEFIRGGYFERYLNKMRKVYREKHDLLLEVLEPFSRDFVIGGENAGLHMLLKDKKGRSEAELLERAREKGVSVYGLSETVIAGAELPKEATILLGYGALTEKQILEGIEKLKIAWHV